MPQSYRSSIPRSATERITERHPNGAKRKAEYVHRGKVVGLRWFDATGALDCECPMRDGQPHGTEYRWDAPGRLTSTTPWVHGQLHGTVRQWDDNGRLIGTYTMTNGTGLDLWWHGNHPSHYLSEAVYWQDGKLHGFEWWINEDQRSVHWERHWHRGQWHGIEREWNAQGRLRRGYPKYFIRGEQVTRRQYLRAAATDPALPPFRPEDNRPERIFPPEVAKALRKPR